MLQSIALSLILGVASSSAPSQGGRDDELWAVYLKSETDVPSGAKIVLLEGMPIVKAAEGYPASLAAVASIFENMFATTFPSFSYAAPAVNTAVLRRMSDLLGGSPTPKEQKRLMDSLSHGDLREAIEPLMKPYKEAMAQAAESRRKDSKILLSLGQMRMAFLRAAAATKGDARSLNNALDGFAALHHARFVGTDTADPSFAEIMTDLKDRHPGMIIYKSGEVYLVVGLIEDGSKRYLVQVDPEHVDQTVRTGRDNVKPEELESKDPRTQNWVRAMMNLKFYLEYKLSRSPDRPAGVLIRPFDPAQYGRWISHRRMEPALGSVPGLEEKLNHIADTIKEVSDVR